MTNSYITVAKGMSSWFAVKMWLNAEDYSEPFWEPYESGFGRYFLREDAVAEAKVWACEEDIDYKE